jgi:hypothetical protein
MLGRRTREKRTSRRTVIPHRHVRDDLLERRLLPQKALIAPVTRLPELIPELLDLAPGWNESAQVSPHLTHRLVGEVCATVCRMKMYRMHSLKSLASAMAKDVKEVKEGEGDLTTQSPRLCPFVCRILDGRFEIVDPSVAALALLQLEV